MHLKKLNSIPLSRTDKLCLLALAGIVLDVGAGGWAVDAAAYREAEKDKPLVTLTVPTPVIDCTALVEAVEARREAAQAGHYDESVPLDRELQVVLWEACEANGVPVCLALGLIQEESGFDPDAVSRKGAYGLFQLNPRYFPDDLDPAGNIAAGVAWLGELLERYGGTAAALRAYNLGYDDGDRVFAGAVLAASEKWGDG